MTRSTGIGNATPRGSGERRVQRSIGIVRPRRSSTAHGSRARRGSRAASSTPASTRSIATCEMGAAEQTALIYDSPVTGVVRRYSYRELLDEVARFAGALAREGVGRGDRVVIYMPMIPEAVIAMLACARLGAIHSVVFGGFGADELAARIDDSRRKDRRLRLVRGRSPARRRVQAARRQRARAPRRGAAAVHRAAAARGAGLSAARKGCGVERVPGRARSRPSACRSPRATRCTSSTRRARPECRRASCATTAATPWR